MVIWVMHHLTGIEKIDEIIYLEDGEVATNNFFQNQVYIVHCMKWIKGLKVKASTKADFAVLVLAYYFCQSCICLNFYCFQTKLRYNNFSKIVFLTGGKRKIPIVLL